MRFKELRSLIKKTSNDIDSSFDFSANIIQKKIFSLNKNELKDLIKEIGTIPEDIIHDSSEEKLYSKTTDIILSKTFQELGLNSSVNKERSNCADVIGKSVFHDYSLVGDAKAFRLSRTAKNQKDFKVKSMVDWKGEHSYSVLVCPYYQYPRSDSQIYGQALLGNVCLISWEHLYFLLENNITETKFLNLSLIWNISERLSETVTIKNKDKNSNFHDRANRLICSDLSINYESLIVYFNEHKKSIIKRGETEIKFWEKRIEEIKLLTHENAISELIIALKLKAKIGTINKYIHSLREDI